MEIILIRHGNTFNKGDKIVWVGRNEDLPLTAEGELQARRVAKNLENVQAVYCAQLQRTRTFAAIITSELRLQPATVDNRLLEIDYGSWGGKSNEEVIALEGNKHLEGWLEHAIWPASWVSTKQEIQSSLSVFLNDLRLHHAKSDKVAVVTSNGCLRCLLDLLIDVPQDVKDSFGKVKTGGICSIIDNGTSIHFNYWNKTPQCL